MSIIYECIFFFYYYLYYCIILFVYYFPTLCNPHDAQVSELEVNGQIEQVCEQVFREMQSQAVEAMPMESLESLPIPGSFRMRSHSYVRAMDQGCSRDEEEEDEGSRSLLLLPASPPRTTATTVRTIQSSTGWLLENVSLRLMQRSHCILPLTDLIDFEWAALNVFWVRLFCRRIRCCLKS